MRKTGVKGSKRGEKRNTRKDPIAHHPSPKKSQKNQAVSSDNEQTNTLPDGLQPPTPLNEPSLEPHPQGIMMNAKKKPQQTQNIMGIRPCTYSLKANSQIFSRPFPPLHTSSDRANGLLGVSYPCVQTIRRRL
jgi:hypothetical protein